MAWLAALIANDNGKPDEARLAFLLCILALIGLKSYSVFFPDHPFNAMDFSAGVGGLLALYNASRGGMGTFGGNK